MNRILGVLLAAVLVFGAGVAGVEATAGPAVANTPEEVAPGTYSAFAEDAAEADLDAVPEDDASGAVADGDTASNEVAVEDAPDENAADALIPSDANDHSEASEFGDFEEPSVQPSIVGNAAAVGVTAVANPGEWAQPELSYTYQWLSNGVPVPGATSQQYLPVPEDAGKILQVAVTGSNADFTATFTSDEVLVAEGALAAPKPSISGTATVGKSLRVNTGIWIPRNTLLSIQWTRDGRDIAGATTSTYALTAADRGKRIGVVVTGTSPGYLSKNLASAVSKPIAAGTLSTVKPKISGTAIVGKTLRASSTKWTPSATKVTFQWKRNGKSIQGATRSTYKLKTADGGKKITVVATGSLAGYAKATRTSGATKSVLKVFTSTPAPRFSGSLRVGSTLSAQVKASKPAATSTSYRWFRNGNAISGATRSTYVLTKSDAGKKISVRVTNKRTGYMTVTKSSTAKRVARVMRASTPRVSGSTTVGSQLWVNTGTWTSGTRLSYQWYRNGFRIAGAQGSTYTLNSGDVGSYFAVVVTGKKAGYASEVRTSGATALVTYPSRTTPTGGWNCPAWAPIKGNASSMIYHVPGGAYYDRTNPEECFSTEAAAQNAGYRRSMR